MNKTAISLVQCKDYSPEKVEAALWQALGQLGGIAAFVKPSQKVLIKPNILTAAPPEKASVTHPQIIRALIRMVKKAGGEAWVGDSPGFESPKRAAEGSGILKVSQEEGAQFVDFNRGREVEFKDGFICKNVMLVNEALDADVIINVAKLKSHVYSGITAAVKNIFGCIPGIIKSQFHLKYPHKDDFNLMLLDLVRIVKPTLNIVDAILAMEGEGGPSNGAPLKMGLLVAGRDAVAVDSVCASLVGKKPLDFDFLKQAADKNVGETNLANIEVLGEMLASNIHHDFKHISVLRDEMLPGWIPKKFIPFMRRFFLDRPVLKKSKCTQCGACFKVCAAKAITLIGGRPTFDYGKCIGCYCCQEMCNFGAITIKKSLLARIFLKIGSLLSR
ncbi:MAG: DUF362 domain-containing protein [Candidatus Margulisbacteria bacterium]|nr:DUF362 domain-containing protein [Candidatus Margulisiibacteriota bacterium]MBU1021310.1 DUF362 domain-containing protein [Candidatus Margulisiibacteriota bacterium]MBU1729201.1 DUF362 domain-containing protein [Candidatus Margulisiibacteriota bacterium]MBU1954874.1 DUF362 domain-containing protein [Candidatus Margulisiibacteriota bacterium]